MSFAIKPISIFVLLAPLALAACRMPSVPGLSPFKIDIQQGNYVTQDMVARLKPGMSRSQVRFALGTPLIADLFHADRWDYVYMLHKAGELADQRQVTVIFRGDALERIEGDVVAGANITPAAGPAATPVPEKK